MIQKSLFTALALLVLGLLAACGNSGAGTTNNAATALPTFTPIPTYGIAVPTSVLANREATAEVTADATAAVTAVASSLDPEMVTRGQGRYEALDCGSCHGAAGEGTDKGSSLLEWNQTEAEFIAFMRSGGDVGATHQYATNRLSDSGGKSLYQYLLSLRESP